MIAFTKFLQFKKRKPTTLIYTIFNSIYIILFLYFLLINPDIIGELRNGIDILYKPFVSIYMIIIIIISLILGLAFSFKAIRSHEQIIKLKGKFLFVAFISFAIGALLDTLLGLSLVGLFIFRPLEILSAITFYLRFILPNWVKRIFIKVNE